MSAFVWFTNHSNSTTDTVDFYRSVLGWEPAAGPEGMTMFAGAEGPFAGVSEATDQTGWLPFAKVDDVDAATARAEALGAEVLSPKTRGPAGFFSVVRDPGGAALALWQAA